jgi:hypothetical protein
MRHLINWYKTNTFATIFKSIYLKRQPPFKTWKTHEPISCYYEVYGKNIKSLNAKGPKY